MHRLNLIPRDVSTTVRDILHYISNGEFVSNNVKVIYFHGWCGFGVTPVLRSIQQEFPSVKWLSEFSLPRLIYIDCSDWKNKRWLQRKIAEELKFDHTVMYMFDKQDEEDDFNEVSQASRDWIQDVSVMIDKTLREKSFMIIFLNGSDEELDLTSFGVPYFSTVVKNVMIWSFKRRFLTIQDDPYSKLEAQLRYTHLFLKSSRDINTLTTSEFRNLLGEEAATIVTRHPCIQGSDVTMVTNCCLFEMFLHYSFHSTTEFAWAAHACNFWICDGIIKGDQTKEICSTLCSEIRWKCDPSVLDGVCQNIMKNDPETPFVVIDGDRVYDNKSYRWISLLTSKNLNIKDQDMKILMKKASSLFVAFEKIANTPAELPEGLFKHSNNLGVLILSCCAFNFAAPPFLQCHGLRFLGVDNCTSDPTKEGEGYNCIEWEFLYSLWVLDMRNTDWNDILEEGKIDLMANLRELNIAGFKSWHYISQLQTRLSYLERLRIICPMQQSKISYNITSNLFLEKTNLEILDLSGNTDMKGLPASLSKVSKLQMLVLDGCEGVENVDDLPSSLTSFSFDAYGPVSLFTSGTELPPASSGPKCPPDQDNKDIKISKISLRGCTQLGNLFLRGLSNLMELDLSGSALKVLDFESMLVDVRGLKRLFLLGCEHLRAIKWGSSESRARLQLLCIDTRPGTWAQPQPDQHHESSSRTLHLHAVLADVRLIRSLWTIIKEEKARFNIEHGPNGEAVQLEAAMSNDPMEPTGVQRRRCLANRYPDVLAEIGDTVAPPMEIFPAPPAERLDRHVEITGGGHILESELRDHLDPVSLADVMQKYVESLHVHDASISKSMTRGYWLPLRWCRVERCPNFEDSLFHLHVYGFRELEVVWVSELAMARCLWSKAHVTWTGQWLSFGSLRHLRLRSCPRLQYALPLRTNGALEHLETIHIVCCGDLRHVFVLGEQDDSDDIQRNGMEFPALTTIHLYDLPKLWGVCEVKMFAPRLHTVRIRGCFNLRRLPAPVKKYSRSLRWPRRPSVEVEKDVWDALEWDGANAGHHPSCYEPPVHSRHFRRRRLLRVSVLR